MWILPNQNQMSYSPQLQEIQQVLESDKGHT